MASNIKARRKLADLYRRGKEIRFGPDGPDFGPFSSKKTDGVAIYVAVPSPLQREQAIRDSRAASLGVKSAAKRDAGSADGRIARSFSEDMTRPELVEYLLLLGQGERDQEAQRDVLAEEEWSDILELQDVLRQYDDGDMPTDGPEYEAVMERDRIYGEQVHNRKVELADAAREALEMLPYEELEKRALAQQIEMLASESFIKEYTRRMVYYAARDPEDRDLLFFESVGELAAMDEVIQDALEEVLGTFIQEESEAKNVRGAEGGSNQSTPPSEPETSEVSTPSE